MYFPNSEACQAFNDLYPPPYPTLYGYRYWPSNAPFLTYTDTMSYILEEDYIQQSFHNEQLITFQAAVYSPYGEFKGFKRIRYELNRC